MTDSFCFNNLELHAETMRTALTTAYTQISHVVDSVCDEDVRAELCLPAMLLHVVLCDLDKYVHARALVEAVEAGE